LPQLTPTWAPVDEAAAADGPTPRAACAAKTDDASGRAARAIIYDRAAVLVLSICYFAVALPYSLITRAWEANDEPDHVKYIEYIVAHGWLPRISAANGHESHQPPLYYLAEAAWQKLLGIASFTPTVTPNPAWHADYLRRGFLNFLHNYTPTQHQDAIYLHELRLVSVVFGLVTVLAAYGSARLLLAHRHAALAVGFTILLWPKLLVVDLAVTNDNLVIALSTVGIFLFLLAERARCLGRPAQRRWLMFAVGTVMGLAAITKYNSLPVAGLLLLLGALPILRDLRSLVDSALSVIGFLATSGWWFVHNAIMYGQFLATKASLAYLKAWIPPLVDPVPWTNKQRFLHFVPARLFVSVWYNGDWNEYTLPKWMNSVLWALAALSVVVAITRLVRAKRLGILAAFTSLLTLAAALGSALAGLAAILLVAQSTTEAEGRLGFVGLVGFALLLVIGTGLPGVKRAATASTFLWPLLLLALDGYIFYYWVVPLRGL